MFYAPDFLIHSLGMAVYVIVFAVVVHVTVMGTGHSRNLDDDDVETQRMQDR